VKPSVTRKVIPVKPVAAPAIASEPELIISVSSLLGAPTGVQLPAVAKVVLSAVPDHVRVAIFYAFTCSHKMTWFSMLRLPNN
jgi:hypothetical protein